MRFLQEDKRTNQEIRVAEIKKGIMPYAEGSALMVMGNTKVICTATVEAGVPAFLEGKGEGWLTAEYAMLPRATQTRNKRPGIKVNGRSQEIQRLIGRSLRAAVELSELGEYTILVDCDVLQADGGTRTASITGAYIAVVEALRKMQQEGLLPQEKPLPLRGQVAAISVGIVNGETCLDLCYAEDSRADVDMNVVMLKPLQSVNQEEELQLIEVQGTAERQGFGRKRWNELLDFAEIGIKELFVLQESALEA